MITNTTPHTVNALASNGPCSHATGSSPQYSSFAAPRSWWQRLSHCFSHAKSSPQSAAAHGGSVPYGGAASPSTAQGAAQSAVLNQGAWLGQSAQVDDSVDEFDRYQLCTEGMTVCANGWERYKVHSEAELLEFNLGRINVLRRSLSCSNEEFNFYVVPLIKSMTRYCLIVPASEGHHDAEVGGLVKHNLQIGIAALELMNQSRTIRISDSVRLNNLFAQAKARKQAAVAAQANATTQEMATAQGDNEEQLDTLARYLRAASDPRAAAARKEMEKTLQETSTGVRALNLSNLQQSIILALQQWREHLEIKFHGRFSEEQISFMMELMMLFHCFAHDLSKLVYDLEIVASNGERYSPYVQTLAQFCEEQHCPYLLLRYVRNRSNLHETKGAGDGYILLARFCWQCLILLAQVSPLGEMIKNPEPVLDLVRKFAESSVISSNMQAQSVGQLYIPSYVNVLIKRLYEARTQDGVLPNELDSDFYTSNNHVLIQNQSRAWALLSWWVQEQEFGPMDMHEQSNASLINKLLLTGNVSRVLQTFKTKALYFMVFLPDSLLFVRGIDLCSSGLSFSSDVTFEHVARKHPLLQQALHAIVLALYHQHQDSLNAINAEHKTAPAASATNKPQAVASLSSESLTSPADNIEDCSTWNAETLSQMDFDTNPALTSVFAHPCATTPHSTAPVAATTSTSTAASAQPLNAAQQEQLQNYRHEQMRVWLQQHQQPQNSVVGDTCDVDAITNCDFDPSQAVASLLAQAPSLAQNPSSEHGSASTEAHATRAANVAQAENTADTVNTASAKEGDNTVKAETANQAEPSRPPYQETADAATSTSSSTGSATGGAGQNIHCSWQEVEFVDMPIPERFTLLKARTTLKQLESGRTWLSRLLAMPNKIAFCPYLGADGIYHTHIKVYFAAQDQDFKKFCRKRSEQRVESNRKRERAAAALGRNACKAASRDSATCSLESTASWDDDYDDE